MKILELRFKNLNSLTGEWFIDFTHPEYTSNGIFALTGPTGAGKSTILDAICLALYGATPRLGRITKSGNEIMSRQTGECYAEVVFESQEGHFRCHWSQHRARKKADGNLADSRHEISDAPAGKPIETKKSLVAQIVEEKTGMDFERFTRSILLAQGGFDTFLKANIEQKSKILEQITGTEIYTTISKRVHDQQRIEQEKYTLLQAEVSGIAILEREEEKETNQLLEIKQKQETELTATIGKTGKAIAWLTGIDNLQAELNSLSEESEKLYKELEMFETDRDLLIAAQKAAQLDGQYATLTSIRKQHSVDLQSLKDEETRLPEVKLSTQQKKEAFEKAELATLQAKKNQKSTAPLIQKIRTIDLQMAEKKNALHSSQTDCKNEARQISTEKKLLEQEEKKFRTAQNNLQLVQQYLDSNLRDEWLVSGLAGITEQLNNLLLFQEDISRKKSTEKRASGHLKSAIKTLAEYTNQLNIQKQELENSQEKIKQKKNDLKALLGKRLLREYRTEKETLLREIAFVHKILNLESERAKLEDGKPCPLCGAGEHPFAKGKVPQTDEEEKRIEELSMLIRKAEQIESSIIQLETVEKQALLKLTDIEKLEFRAVNEKNNRDRLLSDIIKEQQKTIERFADLKKIALRKLQPLGIEVIPDSDVSSLLQSLKKRQQKWQDHLTKKTDIEKQISRLDGELQRLHAVIGTRSTALSEKQAAVDRLNKDYLTCSSERQELFGSTNPDTEETRLSKTVSATELAEKSCRTAYIEANQLLSSIKGNITSLQDRIRERLSELTQLEKEFEDDLQSAGFSNEQLFLKARIPLLERDRLISKAKELDDRQTDLQARKKDRENRLASELEKKITCSQLENLKCAYKEYEHALKLSQNEIGGLTHKLTENRAAQKRIKEKRSAIEAQRKECDRWEKLHSLIGSADGKKYRNFAQGLTFELMVAHANRQLEKMTDRYLLIRDAKHPLTLNVVDNYQAGEIRSTKNLSGGESFIVSLTLALGLSKMSSRKVRVDSLFLDEGFGTLDEETLETALQTLAGLQHEGKIIGIISHIPLLQERLDTQIQIIPGLGGNSRITGPGVVSLQ